jgi:hypothetical protein
MNQYWTCCESRTASWTSSVVCRPRQTCNGLKSPIREPPKPTMIGLVTLQSHASHAAGVPLLLERDGNVAEG